MNQIPSQHNPADFTALNNYFDHVYVLTIDGAEDRQGPLVKLLKGLDWEFFYGTNKKDINIEQLIEQGEYDEQRHLEIKRSNRVMNLGEVACSMSHRAICQDVIDKNYQRVLILEDDVLPVYENLSNFLAVADELPHDWELLMLGYYGEKPPTLKYKIQVNVYLMYHYLHLFNWHKVSAEWIKKLCVTPYKSNLYTMGKLLGSHAYAVSKLGARKFIDYQQPVVIQADRVFSYYDSSSARKAFAVKDKVFTLSEFSKISYIN